MTNSTYLLRAGTVALLLLGSIATVLLVAQRPSSSAPTAEAPSASEALHSAQLR